MPELTEQLVIAKVERRLTESYAQIPADQVSAAGHNAYKLFEQSRIRDFVPLLVERYARAELKSYLAAAS
ncbi:hypothetical protein BH09ACT7_BH09ACT7_10330 [soil metagenome]